MRWLVLALLLSISNSAFAISEGVSYNENIKSVVRPWLASRLKFQKFSTFDGKHVAFGHIETENAKGTIVICPGRTESIVGFIEVLYDLAHQGYSLWIIDHRGQGFSDRIVTSSDVGAVDHFSDYVNDFNRFVKQVVVPRARGPLFLLADSMGGAIALDFLTTDHSTFQSAMIAVPMLKIKTNPLPFPIARVVADTLWYVGRGSTYIPMTGAYNLKADFANNGYTDSVDRFALDLHLTAEFPRIAVGGASVNWLLESMAEGRKLRSSASLVTTPILMIQAGKDSYVENSAQDAFCARAPRCTLVRFPAAQHWIFFAADQVRDQIFGLASFWFKPASGVTKAALVRVIEELAAILLRAGFNDGPNSFGGF